MAILLVTICSALLALINIGNNVAFNGTISLVLEGFYISYFLAIGLLLWRRLRGDLASSNSATTTSIPTPFHAVEPSEAVVQYVSWGPWRLKGAWGVANNVLACCYLLLLIFFSFWPAQVDVENGAGMNWAILVTGFVVLFSVGYYAVWARKTYTGPIVEVDLYTL